MNTIRVSEKAANIDALQLELLGVPRPEAAPGQVIIEVASAGLTRAT